MLPLLFEDKHFRIKSKQKLKAIAIKLIWLRYVTIKQFKNTEASHPLLFQLTPKLIKSQ